MKIVKEPAKDEICEFYDDFTGEKFENSSHVNLKLTFNAGSKYDGSVLQFNLSDESVKPILEIIREKLNDKTKSNIINTVLDTLDKNYEQAMQMRDWGYCDFASNFMSLNKYIVGKEPDPEPYETE